MAVRVVAFAKDRAVIVVAELARMQPMAGRERGAPADHTHPRRSH